MYLKLKIEANLGVIKDQDRFYLVAPLRVIMMETLSMQVPERVVHWVFQK